MDQGLTEEQKHKLEQALKIAEAESREAEAEIDRLVSETDGLSLLATFSVIAAFGADFRNLQQVFNENLGLPYLIKRQVANPARVTAETVEKILRALAVDFSVRSPRELYEAILSGPADGTGASRRLARWHDRISAVNPNLYIPQLVTLVTGVYGPLSEFLERRLGFTPERGLQVSLELLRTVTRVLAPLRLSLEAGLRAADQAARSGEPKPLTPSQREDLGRLIEASENLFFDLSGAPPDVLAVLDSLTTPVGEGYGGGVPLVLKDAGGRVLVPDPHRLAFGVRNVLDQALQSEKEGQTATWQRYQRTRGRFLEDRAAEYLGRVFPPQSIFRQCYYHLDGERYELDLLVDFDGWLIAVEAKGGELGAAARRGAEKSLEQGLRKLLEDALKQGRRAARYTSGAPPFTFFDATGKPLHTISDRPRQVRVLNVTLEHLMSFGVRLKGLQELGLFAQGDYLWTVNLFELDIITAHVGGPSQFLYFVDRRIEAQTLGLFHAFDELTIFGYFAQLGRLPSPRDAQGDTPDAVFLDPDMLEPFDRHYMRGGRAPEVNIETLTLSLIRDLETSGKVGWTDAAMLLIHLPRPLQHEIARKVVGSLGKFRKKGTLQGVSMVWQGPLSLGFTYLVLPTDEDAQERLRETCARRRADSGVETWIGLLKVAGATGQYASRWCVAGKTALS